MNEYPKFTLQRVGGDDVVCYKVEAEYSGGLIAQFAIGLDSNSWLIMNSDGIDIGHPFLFHDLHDVLDHLLDMDPVGDDHV